MKFGKLLALMLPLVLVLVLAVACGGDDPAPTAVPVQPGLTAEDLQAAIAGIQIPEGLSEADVTKIVEGAAQPGLSAADVSKIVSDQLAKQPGISAADLQKAVDEAVKAAVATAAPVQAGITAAELQGIIAGINIPEGLSEADVTRIVEGAAQPGLSAADVSKIVSDQLAKQPGISAADLQKAVDEAVKAAVATAVATAVPMAVMAPSDVNPGKVTFMVSNWGNERFDNIHVFDANVQFTAFVNTNFVAGNEKGEMIPGLVTDWAVSADGLNWALDLREGVKFHDGSTATIEDYLWTIRHNYGEGCPENCSNSNADFALRIDSIEQTGPNQVTLAVNTPDAGLLNLWFSEVGPAVRGVMPKRTSLYGMEEEFDRNPIFAGQMKFVELIVAERMTFERFGDFYYQPANGLPEDRRMKFQTLDILQVPEESTRAAALRAGQADIAPVSLDTRDQVEAGGGRMLFSDQGGYFMTFFVRSDEGSPFDNKNIRKAMSYAFDKVTMMEQLYGGSVVAVAKGWGAVTPGTIGYSPDLDPLPFDPDLARQILADEGYPDGEGFGKVIINTYVSPVHPYLPESAQVAADYWKRELNLDVEVKISEESATKTAWREEELGGQIVFYDNQARLDAAGITNYLYGRSDHPRRMHDDPEILKAVQEAVAVFDPETRPQVLNEMYKMLWDEHIELAVGYVNTPWGLGPRIDAWEPWPLALHMTGRHTITLR